MTANTHLLALKEKHDALDKDIRDELKRPSADIALIDRLKKQKLKLKEEIAQIESSE